MLKLDEYILAWAQRLCDKIQDVFGVSKFVLSRYTLIMASTTFWCMYLISFNWFILIMNLATTYSTYRLIRFSHIEEKFFIKYGQLLFPSAWNGTGVRVVYLIWAAVLFFISLFGSTQDVIFTKIPFVVTANTLSVATWMYVDGCLPKPPSKSKARKLYEKVLTRINNALEPATEPILN